MTHPTRIIALLAAAALSCSDPAGPGEFDALGDPSGYFQTSSTGYRFEREEHGVTGAIAFSYTNTTGATIYPAGCRGLVPPALEKLVDGEWVRAWTPIALRCGATPIPIAPGATYTNTLEVWGAWHDEEKYAPNFEVAEVEGRYRLLWLQVYESFDPDSGPGPQIAEELRISNEFVIELEE